MSTNNNTSDDLISLFDIDTQYFYLIQFWIFLFLIIPSLICSFLALYYFLSDRVLRKNLHHHVIIIILIINIFYNCTDISLFIHYFRSYQSFISTPSFRLFWGYIDWTFAFLQNVLYALATLERHILTFHDQLLSTRRKRLFIHYIPPIVLIIYGMFYYAMIFFVAQCKNNFDDLTIPSFVPCAFKNNAIRMYEITVNTIVPNLIIIMSSTILLFRVLWQRYRIHQQINWRRYRKMTIQVLSISSIYIIFPFPYMLIILFHLCGMPSNIGANFLSRWMFCTYYTLLLFPIVALESLSEFRNKLTNLLCFRQQQQQQRRRIVPAMLHAKVHRRII